MGMQGLEDGHAGCVLVVGHLRSGACLLCPPTLPAPASPSGRRPAYTLHARLRDLPDTPSGLRTLMGLHVNPACPRVACLQAYLDLLAEAEQLLGPEEEAPAPKPRSINTHQADCRCAACNMRRKRHATAQTAAGPGGQAAGQPGEAAGIAQAPDDAGDGAAGCSSADAGDGAAAGSVAGPTACRAADGPGPGPDSLDMAGAAVVEVACNASEGPTGALGMADKAVPQADLQAPDAAGPAPEYEDEGGQDVGGLAEMEPGVPDLDLDLDQLIMWDDVGSGDDGGGGLAMRGGGEPAAAAAPPPPPADSLLLAAGVGEEAAAADGAAELLLAVEGAGPSSAEAAAEDADDGAAAPGSLPPAEAPADAAPAPVLGARPADSDGATEGETDAVTDDDEAPAPGRSAAAVAGAEAQAPAVAADDADDDQQQQQLQTSPGVPGTATPASKV